MFAGAQKRVYKSDTATLGIEAEASFDRTDSADILLVGGSAHLAQVTANPPLTAFVRRIHPTTTWTTSVCTGALALASAGVSAGIDMALTLAARIAGEPFAKALQLALEYDPQPPFDADSPLKAGPELVKLVADLMAPAMAAAPTP